MITMITHVLDAAQTLVLAALPLSEWNRRRFDALFPVVRAEIGSRDCHSTEFVKVEL
jgi:hypothetical protein